MGMVAPVTLAGSSRLPEKPIHFQLDNGGIPGNPVFGIWPAAVEPDLSHRGLKEWRNYFNERAAHWLLGRRGRSRAAAAQLAFGNCLIEWHRRYTVRQHPARCAGCGGPVDDDQILDLGLGAWVHRYNWHRPHGGIKSQTPISRLGLSEDNLLRLHI